MKIVSLPLKDAYIIEPEPFQDQRGVFARIYCKDEFAKIGLTKDIIQINHSLTLQKGSIRGMHFQYPPKAEVKMVRCLQGKVFDVMVDLRRGSPNFLQWHGEILSRENSKMMYIPEGFAHGFQTLEENSELLYLHTEFYSPEFESGVRYNDPKVNISWPKKVTDITDKDKTHPLLPTDFKGIDLS